MAYRKVKRYVKDQVWERFRGPIPPGWRAAVRDGDPLNVRLANLFLCPEREYIDDERHPFVMMAVRD